ncbi:MAG TPA: DUF721 domain-containing protein [Magnetospirillaceae bacterium]|nr:DUF721 domain-containing protein [Magnetospirillaceae bacterium]
MDDSRIRTAAELIAALISPKTAEAAGVWAGLTGVWPVIAGERAAAHTRVVDMDNHILAIEADHPGWIQILLMRRGMLLTDIQARFPALEVRGLQFRLSRKGAAPEPGGKDQRAKAGTVTKPVPDDSPFLQDRSLELGTADAGESAIGDGALRAALNSLRDAFYDR